MDIEMPYIRLLIIPEIMAVLYFSTIVIISNN